MIPKIFPVRVVYGQEGKSQTFEDSDFFKVVFDYNAKIDNLKVTTTTTLGLPTGVKENKYIKSPSRFETIEAYHTESESSNGLPYATFSVTDRHGEIFTFKRRNVIGGSGYGFDYETIPGQLLVFYTDGRIGVTKTIVFCKPKSFLIEWKED